MKILSLFLGLVSNETFPKLNNTLTAALTWGMQVIDRAAWFFLSLETTPRLVLGISAVFPGFSRLATASSR